MSPNNNFKLNVSSASINPLNLEVAFETASRLKYDGIEVMVTPDKHTQDISKIKNLVQKYQMPVPTIHSPTLLVCSFVWGRKPEPKLQKTLELAQELGSKSIVVHPPFKTNPYSSRFLEVINSLEEHYDVDIAVENMFPWSFRSFTKEIYGPKWSDIAESAESLTLDFSHAAASGLDILSEIKKHHKKVKVIHLCDGKTRTFSKGDAVIDEHLLPGEGDMPIKEVYDFLKTVDWKGETVLEINTRGKNVDTDLHLQKSLDYFRSL